VPEQTPGLDRPAEPFELTRSERLRVRSGRNGELGRGDKLARARLLHSWRREVDHRPEGVAVTQQDIAASLSVHGVPMSWRHVTQRAWKNWATPGADRGMTGSA